ncbi:hypothetical protein [Burkholderia glumae]|uniref:hypothetical protein n=1 Tax=Burkholderia glumae TaxID=337 RepID=UPI0039A7542A
MKKIIAALAAAAAVLSLVACAGPASNSTAPTPAATLAKLQTAIIDGCSVVQPTLGAWQRSTPSLGRGERQRPVLHCRVVDHRHVRAVARRYRRTGRDRCRERFGLHPGGAEARHRGRNQLVRPDREERYRGVQQRERGSGGGKPVTPHDFALLAREAYTAAPDIGVADSASRAIVRHTAGGLVVAFPGTDNVASWLADLDVLPIDVAGVGLVHRGSGMPGRQSRRPSPRRSARSRSRSSAIRSGRLAICAAAALTSAGRATAAVYGFEPPRVAAGPRLALLLAGVPVHLFKNGNDVVPDVPPGWHHVALLTHIGAPVLPFPNVEDHAIDRVIAALASPMQ